MQQAVNEIKTKPFDKMKKQRGPTRDYIPPSQDFTCKIAKVDYTAFTRPSVNVDTVRAIYPNVFHKKTNIIPLIDRKYKHRIGKVSFYHKSSPKTSVCWYCTEPFSNEPVHCPRAFYQQSNSYIMEGTFCNYRCVIAYANIHLTKSGEASNAIAHVHRIMRTNGVKDPIKPAPHWSCLLKFGGYMTIDEFRSCPQIQIPYVLPAGSRTIFSGYSHVLTDPNDPVERVNRFKGLEIPECALPDVSQLPSSTKSWPKQANAITYTRKPPQVNSTQFQKELKKEQTSFAFQRQKRTVKSAVTNMHSMLGMTKK